MSNAIFNWQFSISDEGENSFGTAVGWERILEALPPHLRDISKTPRAACNQRRQPQLRVPRQSMGTRGSTHRTEAMFAH
ncbi:MAG: hypothetical protein AB4352_00960 [Hormoscilla sp.]